MDNILIFKTASDNVMNRLLNELQKQRSFKYCLIQSSTLNSYYSKYEDIKFIDIKQEGFYNISDDIVKSLSQKKFEKIYIPITGVRANNFGNVIEICNKLHFNELVFFNCDGEKSIVRKKSSFIERLIKVYINVIEFLYR